MTTSPLLALPGAVAGNGVDAPVAAHYGSLYGEQRTLATGEGFVDLSHRDVLRISGPDRLTYLEMLQVAAEVRGGHRVPIVQVPVLTPRLSSYWLALVTDVDTTTGRNLIDSMSTEVVVTDHSIREVVPGEPLTYAEAVRRALAESTA